MRHLTLWTLVASALSACAVATTDPYRPISIEFGHEYLSDAYLTATPRSHCGHPDFAPAGVDVGAPLPDGTWFRVFSLGASSNDVRTVVLERGAVAWESRLTMRLDAEEGIVRLTERGRQDAWGIHHPWADWLRDLGERAESLECARLE